MTGNDHERERRLQRLAIGLLSLSAVLSAAAILLVLSLLL